jgi:hypothetical protein
MIGRPPFGKNEYIIDLTLVFEELWRINVGNCFTKDLIAVLVSAARRATVDPDLACPPGLLYACIADTPRKRRNPPSFVHDLKENSTSVV